MVVMLSINVQLYDSIIQGLVVLSTYSLDVYPITLENNIMRSYVLPVFTVSLFPQHQMNVLYSVTRSKRLVPCRFLNVFHTPKPASYEVDYSSSLSKNKFRLSTSL